MYELNGFVVSRYGPATQSPGEQSKREQVKGTYLAIRPNQFSIIESILKHKLYFFALHVIDIWRGRSEMLMKFKLGGERGEVERRSWLEA